MNGQERSKIQELAELVAASESPADEWDRFSSALGLGSVGFDGEIRVVDAETGGAKGRKLARTELLPTDALLAISEHFGRGAAKYDDRNWELGYAWSLSYGALLRHLWAWWGGEDFDAETGSHHLDAVGFHVLALRANVIRDNGTDDRP